MAMKIIGIILLILGITLGISAFNMDTTVEAGGQTFGTFPYEITVPKTRVHNVGLIEARNNYMYLSGLLVVVGVLLVGFGANADAVRQSAAKPAPREATAAELADADLASFTAGRAIDLAAMRRLVDAANSRPDILTAVSSQNGNTLLHALAKENLYVEAQELVGLGASLTAVNGSGQKPYQLATADVVVGILTPAA